MRDTRTILSRLYEQHADLFFSVALSITRSRSDAEDAIQTAFGKVLANGSRMEHPRAYMVRAVRNCALDLKRKQQLSFSEPILEPSTHPEYPADTLDFLLGHLKEQDREILILKLVQGLSFREIAELGDLPSNSIATRYRRALEQLRSISIKERSL